jgi:hypothetical protein
MSKFTSRLKFEKSSVSLACVAVVNVSATDMVARRPLLQHEATLHPFAVRTLLAVIMSYEVNEDLPATQITDEPEESPRSTTPRSPSTIHEYSTSLLKLPLELRQQIYNLVFHDNPAHGDPCWNSWLKQGCQCGGGLSATNCQLYREVRALVYRHRRFTFSNPERCLSFLKQIGDSRVRYIGSFAVHWEQKPHLLREILDRLRACICLHTLCLEACDVRADSHIKVIS